MQNTENVLLMLGRLEGKLDAVFQNVKTQNITIKDIENRVSKLEQSKAWLFGRLAFAATTASGLGLSGYLVTRGMF